MTRAAVVFALVFWVLPTASAEPSKSVSLEELTWTEVRDATQAGKTIIIVPIGGTEQSGPHMALGKHNARVKWLSEKIASRLGNALVAPVLAYVPEGQSSPPTLHMRFPGTISVPDKVFEELLESAARGFRLHGFKDIVFLGDHGGYQDVLRKTAASLNREWAKTSVRAHAIEEYYRAADVAFAQALKAKGFSEAEIGTHAGLADTSLTLAIDPGLVRIDRLKLSPNAKAEGVNGDPRRSSAELGRLGVDLIVERTVEAIKASVARR